MLATLPNSDSLFFSTRSQRSPGSMFSIQVTSHCTPSPVCAVLGAKFSRNSFTVHSTYLSLTERSAELVGVWVWQPTVTLPWISGSYQSSQAPSFGPCRRACICVVGCQGKTGAKLSANVAASFYWFLFLSRTKVNLRWTFALCTSTWTCYGEKKSSVYANFPSVRLSWKACLFKQCITWDDVCGTEGLPQEKVLRGYVRIPLPSHVIMNFPPLCLPSMLLSSGKYLNTRNKCHCLSLTAA